MARSEFSDKQTASGRPARSTLSVAIIAKDEAMNLPRTFASIAWVDEIVLVDSGSSDGTVALAQGYGAEVFFEPWQGFGRQKNIALDHCSMDWILSLDADEEVSPALRDSILALLASESAFNAYSVKRRNHFLNRWLRHGGLYPDPKIRLFRRDAAHFADRPVHEDIAFDGPVGRLDGDLLHYAYPTLAVYLEHLDRYSTASIPLVLRKEKNSRSLPEFVWNTILNPLATFAYNYFVRLGFLDGREGFLFHLYHSVYVNWKYVKAWQAARGPGPERPPPPE